MRITVAIPVWEMRGYGVQMLERNLESLEQQTFKDFEVVVTDNSTDEKLLHLIQDYKNLTIRYKRVSQRGMAVNTNEAIKMANGELIKILYQDDYLFHDKSLQVISDNFKLWDTWLITACSNNLFPKYTSKNTLGSPSVLTIKNKDPLLFNDLKWCLDLDYYKRMFDKYGLPKIINDVNVVMGLGEWQESNNLSLEVKIKEEQNV